MIAILRIYGILLLLLLIAIFLVHQRKKAIPQSFDRELVLPIKGILCLLIVITHISQWLVKLDLIPYQISGRYFNWGVPVVCCFFFLSGYGLMQSYLNRGESYLQSFASRRISKLLPAFLFTSLAFVFIKILFMGYDWDYLLRVFTFDYFSACLIPIANSWYVYASVLFYTLFWLACKYLHTPLSRCLSITAGVIGYMALILWLGWPEAWWNAAPAFAIGSAFPYFEPWLLPRYDRYPRATICITIAILMMVAGLGIVFNQPFPIYWIAPVFLVIACRYLPRMQWRPLCWLGTISYEVYLTHEVVICVLISIAPHITLFAAAVMVLSVLSGYIVRQTTNLLSRH